MPSVILITGKEKIFSRKHPWIFSGAVHKVEGINQNGETVEIHSFDGRPLGFGSYSGNSQIRVRVWSFNPDENIDIEFFRKRILSAIEIRKQIIQESITNAYRIVNSENDFVPGLIVDRYNKYLVCQFLSAGVEFWKKEIVQILSSLPEVEGIFERSDSDIREKEGLGKCSGVLFGKEPPEILEVLENNIHFNVDVKNGHKTGFYLDQRDNRLLLSKYTKDKEVLNCFAYTGGFSLFALKGGAKKVTNIDSSRSSLDLCAANHQLNKFSETQFENLEEDVFTSLRKFRDSGKSFDVIVLDPPKFAESVSQIESAARGYKDINLLAIKLLRKNGILFTFSCSGHISSELFLKLVFDAAIDAGKNLRIVHYLKQSPDHTVSTFFPEGLYLKGLVCVVD